MKFLSFLLALILCLSFSVTAFADEVLEEMETLSPEEVVSSYDPLLGVVIDDIKTDITEVKSDIEELQNQVDLINEELPEVLNAGEVTEPNLDPEEEPEDDGEYNPSTFDENTPTAVNVYSLNPITPEDTTGLKSVLLSLIGDYDAIIVEYEYQGNNSYYNYLREVQPDYVWLCSAAIFLVIIYSVFRLGGALFG